MRDPDGASLDRIQVVKGWIEDGTTREKVYDVAQPDVCDGCQLANGCSDGAFAPPPNRHIRWPTTSVHQIERRSNMRLQPRRLTQVMIAFVVALVLGDLVMAQTTDPLPSWNHGKVKQSIINFVAKVTKQGSPNFVPPAERIATFDNDGTLWAEQPLYFQFLFAFDRVKALAPKHPEWKDKDPFASLLRGDVKGALAGGKPAIVEIIMETHAGMTTAEFEKIVEQWIATAQHPTKKRPYTEMVYQSMLELLAHLRANGFKTFIVSGGGIEFMRPWVERIYGIPPEQVVEAASRPSMKCATTSPCSCGCRRQTSLTTRTASL